MKRKEDNKTLQDWIEWAEEIDNDYNGDGEGYEQKLVDVKDYDPYIETIIEKIFFNNKDHYCQRPLSHSPCGVCKICKMLEDIEEELKGALFVKQKHDE